METEKLICEGYGFLGNDINELKVLCLSGNELYPKLLTEADPSSVFIYHCPDIISVLEWAEKNDIETGSIYANLILDFEPAPFKLFNNNGTYRLEI